VLAVHSSAQLEKSCLKKKWCVIVLGAGSRLLDVERKALAAASQAERGVRFVTVDTSKDNLLLDLPGGVAAPTAQTSTVLVLKQLSGSTDKATLTGAAVVEGGLGDLPVTLTTLRAAMDSTEELPAGFTKLDKQPMLKPREVVKVQSKPKVSVKENDNSKTLTDDELKALRAERASEAERLRREAELQRREEMAEEEANAGNILEEVSPFEEEEEAAEEEEEEAAEAMELED